MNMEINNLATSNNISVEQFNELLVQGNENVDSLLEKVGTKKSVKIVDIEYEVFANSTVDGVKIYKSSSGIQWCNPDDRKSVALDAISIAAVRGFVLKAKDGYSMWHDEENKFQIDKETGNSTLKPPICSTVSCTIGDTVFNTNTPSPMPLFSYQANMGSNIPRQDIVDLKLMGSRGESCADCIFNGRNKDIGKARCAPSTGYLFAITEVARKSNKTESGLLWTPIEECQNAEGEKIYNGPVIVYFITSPSNNGSGGKNSLKTAGSKDAINIKHCNNGGPKYVPEDVQLFYNYFTELRNKQLLSSASLHPRLPFTSRAYTEMYFTTPEIPVPYTTSLLGFRTVSDINSDPELSKRLLECLKTYTVAYENYKAEHAIDDSIIPESTGLPPNTLSLLPTKASIDDSISDSNSNSTDGEVETLTTYKLNRN